MESHFYQLFAVLAGRHRTVPCLPCLPRLQEERYRMLYRLSVLYYNFKLRQRQKGIINYGITQSAQEERHYIVK